MHFFQRPRPGLQLLQTSSGGAAVPELPFPVLSRGKGTEPGPAAGQVQAHKPPAAAPRSLLTTEHLQDSLPNSLPSLPRRPQSGAHRGAGCRASPVPAAPRRCGEGDDAESRGTPRLGTVLPAERLMRRLSVGRKGEPRAVLQSQAGERKISSTFLRLRQPRASRRHVSTFHLPLEQIQLLWSSKDFNVNFPGRPL